MTKRGDETGKSLFFRKRSSLAGAALQALCKLFFFKPRDRKGNNVALLTCFLHHPFNVAHVLRDAVLNKERDEIRSIYIFPAAAEGSKKSFSSSRFSGLRTQKETHNQPWKRVIHPKPHSVRRVSCFVKAAVTTSLSWASEILGLRLQALNYGAILGLGVAGHSSLPLCLLLHSSLMGHNDLIPSNDL